MSSIASLFPNQTLVDVLSLLLLHPDESFYQRSIAERTGHALLQVQNALERLEQSGLLIKEKSGNRVYYQAERKHPAYQDLKNLLIKTVALGDLFREKLAPYQEQIRFAFVFGSIAQGRETAESDIDLFIAGNLSLKTLSGVIASMSETVGREVNPVVYSMEELQTKAKEGNHFVRELVASPKIWLMGDQDEFANVAG